MKVRDWHTASFVAFAAGLVAFLNTFVLDIFIQITALAFTIGIIVVLIRRGLLKAKRSIFDREKKKQAV